MIRDSTLEPCNQSKWASPSFPIPKEDESIRFILDFQELNKVIKQKLFPLPRIQDVLNRRGKYKYFTKIDLSIMFYCFKLDDASKKLCMINTPFGLF